MFRNDIQLTPEVKKHQTILFVIFGIGMFLALCKLFEAAQIAVSEVLILMLFLCGALYTNYCLLVFFIIMTLFSEVQYLMQFGIIAQIGIVLKRNKFYEMNGSQLFFFAVLGVTFLFNLFALYEAFNAYRVFKYEAFKGMIGNANSGGRAFTAQDEENRNNRNQGNDRPAFQGQGIVF